jgi:hypothetical protein
MDGILTPNRETKMTIDAHADKVSLAIRPAARQHRRRTHPRMPLCGGDANVWHYSGPSTWRLPWHQDSKRR